MANFPPPNMMYPNAFGSVYSSAQTNPVNQATGGNNNVNNYSSTMPNHHGHHNHQPVVQHPNYANHQNMIPQAGGMEHLTQKMGSMVLNQGWNAAWQNESVNLLGEKDIRCKAIQEEINKRAYEQQQHPQDLCCDKNVMRCTLKKIPETASLLQKCRLPLGVLLHPFKDDPNIPVIQDSPIVRCRSCRTYINPYVRLLDQRRWQCNLCHRINEVPEEFIYDIHTGQHIDIMTRPEMNYGSIEFVASMEYMVRPPQPATYLFVFECTSSAVQSGYIKHFASAMLQSLDRIPGDSRTLIGFMAFDSKLHFFNLNDTRPVHMIMPDITDIFIPHADCVLVNFHSCRKQIEEFLQNVLPTFPFDRTSSEESQNVADHEAALGPALQVAFKVVSPSGGRITLIQTSIPSAGNKSEGCVLANREDPNSRTVNSSNSNAALTPLLNPATDFFKKLALECSEHQVTVDQFNLSASYTDLATVSTVSKYSGGSIQYYGSGGNPSSAAAHKAMLTRFEEDMKRYLTRSIGFEAVMRLRATRGISIHTFHGNFFVRSTDLIALPTVNPDQAYGIQMSITDDLKDFNQASFQAALLYTTSNGERRIRVHTIAFPVVSVINDVINSADHEAILSLLAKMAVDRSCQASIQDAREALINANIDIISTYRVVNQPQYAGLFTSAANRLLPLYTLALLKQTAFRLGISTRIDERVYAMEMMKSLPIKYLMLYIYPNLYPVHYQFDPKVNPPIPLQLSFSNIDRNGVYLLDTYDHLFLYICKSVHPQFLTEVFNVTQWSQIPDEGDQGSTAVSTPAARNMASGTVPAPPPPMVNGFNQAHVPPPHPPHPVNKLTHADSFQSDGTAEDVSEITNSGDASVSDATVLSTCPKKSPLISLPVLDNPTSQRIHEFIDSLIANRPFKPCFHVLREDSRLRYSFLQYMYDDRNESAFSYYEFLQHLQQNMEK